MTAQQILDSAAVKGKRGVYCIGSFAKRVNFNAQQHRALNLVWALKEQNKFKQGDSVAVIGGGLTGMTAAAALIGHGCQVDVYESSLDAMPRQRDTDHRLVHPMINRWPDRAPDITTCLPFLEWHAGVCSEIAHDLSKQFKELKGEENRFFPGHSATAIVEIGTQLLRVAVEPEIPYTPSSGAPRTPSYRLVILAVGFGEERPCAAFRHYEYWHPDGLERDRTTRKQEKFIVSGCGDGGLIDTLRIIHLEFDKGMLAFKTAAELYDSEVASIIRPAEEFAIEQGDPGGLARAYEEAVALFKRDSKYQGTLSRLEESLERFSGVVYLSDEKLDSMFSLNAAPIHKFMVEHAKQNGRVTYSKGTVNQTGDEISLDGLRFPEAKTRVITRHGAKPAFGLLLTQLQYDDLRAKQAILADYHVDPAWKGPYPVPKNMPERDEANPAFVESRLRLAGNAITAMFKSGTVALAGAGFDVIYQGAVPATAPKSLFGIPTNSRAEKSAVGI